MEEKENIIMALLTLKTCFKPPLKKRKKHLVRALLSEDKSTKTSLKRNSALCKTMTYMHWSIYIMKMTSQKTKQNYAKPKEREP